MEIRLTGSIPEIQDVIAQIRKTFRVESESRPYKNRNDDLYRVYVEIKVSESE